MAEQSGHLHKAFHPAQVRDSPGCCLRLLQAGHSCVGTSQACSFYRLPGMVRGEIAEAILEPRPSASLLPVYRRGTIVSFFRVPVDSQYV